MLEMLSERISPLIKCPLDHIMVHLTVVLQLFFLTCYFFTSTYQPLTIPPEGPSFQERIPHQACGFSLNSLVTNRSLWTADTSITTPDLSVRHTGFNIHFQIPNLTWLLLLPWQQHHGLPHTLLAVSSILKRIPRVTDGVIYHTYHLVQKLWSASNKGAATCFFPAYSHVSLDSLLSPIKHDKRTPQVCAYVASAVWNMIPGLLSDFDSLSFWSWHLCDDLAWLELDHCLMSF